jgi:hypothetical protein
METHRSEKPKSGSKTRPSEKNEKEGGGGPCSKYRMAGSDKNSMMRELHLPVGT